MINISEVLVSEIPAKAHSVLYLKQGTNSTMQRNLLTDEDRNWDSIKKEDTGWSSYGVRFKDKDHKELPYTYIIRAASVVKDIMDLFGDEYNIEDDFEQAEVSRVLEGTHLMTYIKAQLLNELINVPFDPHTTKIAASKKEWAKIREYRTKIGKGKFTAVSEGVYKSGDVQITFNKLNSDYDDFGIAPVGIHYTDRSSYEWFVGVGDTKNIGEGLTFGMAKVERLEYQGEGKREIFEDGIILPEEYRWGEVALDIYRCFIDFAKRKGVYTISSDCDLTPWSASIYERLAKLRYKVHRNPESKWSGQGQNKKLRTANSTPNYVIEL